MKSYTKLRNLFGSTTNNISTSNLTLGDQWMNDAIRKIIGLSTSWYFLEATATDTTVASQKNYLLPFNFNKMNSVTMTIGTYKYPILEVTDRKYWDHLQFVPYSSSIPIYYFIDAGQLFVYPTPSASGNTINYNYRVEVRDLANADYTAGTVAFTNGSKAVVGTGTTFTAAMVGRYLSVNADGYWYKIASFTNTTSITLEKNFNGTTVTGAAYTMGEMPIIPEDYHDLLVFYAVFQYWLTNSDQRFNEYKILWEEGVKTLKSYAAKTSTVGLDEERPIMNPNLFIETI